MNSFKRKLRRRAEKEVSKRLKVEIMSKVNARYAVTSNNDSESSDYSLSYINSINECDVQMNYLEQEPVLTTNTLSRRRNQ